MRFLEDLLSLYHTLEGTAALPRVEAAALGHRGTFGLTGDELRARFVGDTAVAWSYFRGKSAELAANDPSATTCVHAASVLDEGELEQLANGARSAGATPHELLVREAVVAARGWNERHGAGKSALPLRVSWLVDLRKLADAVMPAANLSGILFHDFPPGAASEEELDRAEARFIATMRYRTLRGDAMARVTLARVLGRVPGGVLRLTRPPMLRGGAGALHVAEINGALAGARLPRDARGRVRAGHTTVERVDLLPSLRPGTPVALGAVFYADRLCLTAHAGGNDARAILDLYVGALRSVMMDQKAFAKTFEDRIARAKERRPADALWSLPLGKRSGPVVRPGPAS